MTPSDHGAAGQRGEGKGTSPGPRGRQADAAGSGEGASTARASAVASSEVGSSTGTSGAGPAGGGRAGGGSRSGRRPAGDDEVGLAERVRVLIGLPSGPWPLGVAVPPDLDAVAKTLEAEPEITIVQRIVARPPARTGTGFDAGGPAVLVAELPVARANALQRHLHLVVEADSLLEPAVWAPTVDVAFSAAAVMAMAATAVDVVPPFYGSPLTITVTVTDPNGQPVQEAVVAAVGRRGPSLALTDAKGLAELTLLEDSPESIRSLTVVPARDHWGRWIAEPRLDPDGGNTVEVERLDATIPGFGDQPQLGWGLRAMRIDQLPPAMQGRGVKIAFVDSGAATGTHPDLRSPSTGFDLVVGNATGWKEDDLAHGTHCLGIVAAASSGAGVRGIAPEADAVIYKVLPGGRCSTLIEAIDRCIEEQVDVINLGLCTTRPSALVEQRLQQARQFGIACIAAAGNTSGPVAYPAASPAVLAVAAVGRLGEYPPDSPHALQPAPGVPIAPDGFFAARPSAHGWEVDVCGPGVAVVSTVPPEGYAAWDGTSTAATHVSGLAALLLAHHPDFTTGAFRARTAARVDRLFDILRRSARPLPLGDLRRTGVGLPDALVAFGDIIPAAPGASWSASPTIDLTAPLDQLAAVMHQAGIVPGNGGGNGNGKRSRPEKAGGAGEADVALNQLRETLERAGIRLSGERP